MQEDSYKSKKMNFKEYWGKHQESRVLSKLQILDMKMFVGYVKDGKNIHSHGIKMYQEKEIQILFLFILILKDINKFIFLK
jgi:hypothetical protein